MAPPTDEVVALPVVEAELTPPSASPWLPWLAVLLAALAALEALAILLLGTRGDPRFQLVLDFTAIGFFGTIVLFPAVGAFIVVRRPNTRLAWVMIVMAVTFGAGLLAAAYGSLNVTPSGSNLAPLAFELLLASTLLFVPTLAIGTTLLLLLYPTDTLLGPRWRMVAALAVVGSVLWDVAVVVQPGFIENGSVANVPNPLGAPPELAPLVELSSGLANVLILVAILLAAASQFLRYRRGDQVVRAQIRWFSVVAAAVVVSLALATILAEEGELFFGLGVTALACLPIAIGVAITRYRLYDIDLIINRAIVYGSLTAILAGVFTAGVGLAQRLFVTFTGQSSDAAIVLATLVIATLYAPVRKRVEGVVDKRFKYETRRFGAYTEQVRAVLAVIDPARAAEKLAKEAVSELGATGAAVVDASGAVLGSAGTWPVPGDVPTTRVALADEGPIRAILVAPGRGGRAHAASGLAALEEAGRLAAAAALLGARDTPPPPEAFAWRSRPMSAGVDLDEPEAVRRATTD